MKEHLVALRQLDQQLLPLKNATSHQAPKQGWARTIRKALGMTIKQLAKRLGVNPSRVVKIETAEIEGAVTLRTMQSVAQNLGCVFVYSFIPQSSLEEAVQHQANKLAKEQIKRTSHTMDLEAQSVNKNYLNEQEKELASELLRKSWKHLWEI